jgi:DNA-binding HxlR family transcriptional regulator
MTMKATLRSPCPVASCLDLFGDKWTLLLIRDMACGKTQFKEFSQSPEKIATNILTDRLQKLTEAGLIETQDLEGTPGRQGYRLTKRGMSLLPILEAMKKWGLKHIPGTEARMKPKTR